MGAIVGPAVRFECSQLAGSYRAQRKQPGVQGQGEVPPSPFQTLAEISITLPALGTSEKIRLGSHKKPRRGEQETFEVCDALLLVLEATEGIGSWKRAFEVPHTLLNRWGYPMRKPMPMVAIPYPDED